MLIPAALSCFAFSLIGASTIGVGMTIALIGVATGMEFDMLGFLAARYIGLASYAKIYGRLYMFIVGGSAGAPFAFGLLFDHTHSYTIAFILAGSLLLIGAAGFLALGRYPTLPVERI